MVRINVAIVAGEGDRQETGSYGYGGREGYSRLNRDASLAVARSTMPSDRRWWISESVPAPAGEMDVVLGAGWPGMMLHEAIGHGLEGDFNRKKTRPSPG